MNHLFRELAPISEAGWQEIENEAKRTLKTTLAARKLVDFVGTIGLAGISGRHRSQQDRGATRAHQRRDATARGAAAG